MSENVQLNILKDGQYVVLSFREYDVGLSGYHVYTRTKKEVEEAPDAPPGRHALGYGSLLCDVKEVKDKGWQIDDVREIKEGGLPDEIKRTFWPDHITAAKVYYAFKEGLAKEYATHPIPEDIAQYIRYKADHLKRRRDQLDNEYRVLQQDRRELLHYARKYNLENVKWATEDSDTFKECQDLINFSLDGDNPDKDKPTLIDYIYEQFGKDAGRAYRGYLQSALKHVDPSIEI